MLGYLEKGIQIRMAQGRSAKIISMSKWIRTSRLSIKKNSVWTAGMKDTVVTDPAKFREQGGTILVNCFDFLDSQCECSGNRTIPVVNLVQICLVLCPESTNVSGITFSNSLFRTSDPFVRQSPILLHTSKDTSLYYRSLTLLLRPLTLLLTLLLRPLTTHGVR